MLTESPNMLRSRHRGPRVKLSLRPFCEWIPGPTRAIWRVWSSKIFYPSIHNTFDLFQPYLSTPHPCVHPFVRKSKHPSFSSIVISLFSFPSFLQSIHPPIHPSIYSSIHLSVRPIKKLYIHLFFFLPSFACTYFSAFVQFLFLSTLFRKNKTVRKKKNIVREAMQYLSRY